MRRRTIPDYDDPVLVAEYDKRPSTTRAELRVLSRFARVPEGSVVLDVPCGRGRLGPFLRGLSPRRLVGVDGSFQMVRAAGTADGRAGYDELIVADASGLPIASRAADLTICMRLLHHFPRVDDRLAILAEIRRVTRGVAIVSYYDCRTLEGIRRRLGRSARTGVSRARMRGELEAAGLRVLGMRSLLPLVREQTLLLARAP